jgi:hypothetical protein
MKYRLLGKSGADSRKRVDTALVGAGGEPSANENREEQSNMTNETVIMLIEARIQPQCRTELVEAARQYLPLVRAEHGVQAFYITARKDDPIHLFSTRSTGRKQRWISICSRTLLAPHSTSGAQAGAVICELALLANFACNVAGSSGSRPEIGAGSDAPLANLDHDGDLRADRTCSATPGARAAFGVRHKFTVHYGPIRPDFESHRNGCNRRQVVEKIGGASRDRTDDLIVANDALSQLSYSPI